MPQTISTTGTDLFHLSAQYLGDATQWILIAQQNGNLSDPNITGSPPQRLVIPDPNPNATGGAPTQ